MATKRFGYLDDFTLKNSKVGIGTSTANEKLEVLGGSRSQDIKVTGIATLTSYEGFQNKNTSYTENVNITGGESGTLSGEIVIGAGLTMSVGTGATTGQGSIKSLKVSNTFTPPIGGTNDRPSAPQPGALFYNKDFRTIEYWDGNFWRQVDNTTTSGRAIWNRNSVLHQVNLITGGDATNFGESLTDRTQGGAFGSSIRGIFVGDSSMNTNMDYVALASQGNSVDFGNSSQGRRYGSGHSSSTRGLYAGGRTPGLVDTIDYVEIMTTGNAIDFGNLTFSDRTYNTGCGSPTRGLFADSGNEPSRGKLNKVTIASTGNAVDFGKSGFGGGYFAGTSNSVRALFGGRRTPGQGLSIGDVNSVIVASDGNGTYFGDLTIARVFATATSSSTRGVWMGGKTAQSPLTEAYTTRIDYFNFDSAGNAIDFGDLTYINNSRSDLACATSDCHGGLGGF
jgi:hypothetical protein